jgi:hypothetical protein
MRYIPEYYTVTFQEYKAGIELENKQGDLRITPELIAEVEESCKQYKADIVKAIKLAYEQHIAKYQGLNVIYSRSWK